MRRDVQSFSVCVPGKACVNKCKYCVSRMHTTVYKNQMYGNLPCYDLYLEEYVKRMAFAKENEANILMITGDVEPLQNRSFLQTLAMINNYILPTKGCGSFNWIELQTSGVFFDRDYARFLRNTVGVSVLSLSLASFNSEENASIQCTPPGQSVDIENVCAIAKEYDFILRLSLNMNEYMLRSAGGTVQGLFERTKKLGADQVTFRKLYTEGKNEQSEWVRSHTVGEKVFKQINQYIMKNGKHIGNLPYGYRQYMVNDISTVVDKDCMNEGKAKKSTSKYFVLRPDCKIYSGWQKHDIIF